MESARIRLRVIPTPKLCFKDSVSASHQKCGFLRSCDAFDLVATTTSGIQASFQNGGVIAAVPSVIIVGAMLVLSFLCYSRGVPSVSNQQWLKTVGSCKSLWDFRLDSNLCGGSKGPVHRISGSSERVPAPPPKP